MNRLTDLLTSTVPLGDVCDRSATNGGIRTNYELRTKAEREQTRLFDSETIIPIRGQPTKVVVIRDHAALLGIGADLTAWQRAQQGGPGPEVNLRPRSQRRRRRWFAWGRQR